MLNRSPFLLAAAMLTALSASVRAADEETVANPFDPEIQGGTACFAGTRVPVKSLFDSLAHGRSLDYFLAQFPTVKREQAADVFQQAGQLVANPPQRPQAA